MIHTISESSQRQTIMEDQDLEYDFIQAKHVCLLPKPLSNTKAVVKPVPWKLMTTACQGEYDTTIADIIRDKVQAAQKFSDAWSSHLPTAAARSQNLGHSQKKKNNRITTATKLSVACPKTPNKVRVLGDRDLFALQQQRR